MQKTRYKDNWGKRLGKLNCITITETSFKENLILQLFLKIWFYFSLQLTALYLTRKFPLAIIKINEIA